MAWASGQKLQGGRYTIERKLGEGGFGITYCARDRNGRYVAIKTLNEQVQHRPDFAKFQQDFLNEAIRLARCSHPYIVRIEEVIQEGLLWCMVMEYIDGEDLASWVVKQGALSEAVALSYMQQIGSALTVVHNNGLLHRDIKPHNIMLRANSEAVLIDFGIAREFTPNLTRTHTQMLSDGFAPIEQYDQRAKRGAYTDVYALAGTLYSLLTGGEVPTPAPLRAIGTSLAEPKKLNPRIGDRVNQAILKGMEVKPEDRPQSIQEWLSLLNVSVNLPPVNNIIQEFNSHVDRGSPSAGILIHHREHRKAHVLHYHITISETHAFNFGANGFAIFPIPSQFKRVRGVELFNRKEVLDRCLIAYQLFQDWYYNDLGWNCEHFARLVTTGEAISYQVKKSRFASLNHHGYHSLAKEMMDKACKRKKP